EHPFLEAALQHPRERGRAVREHVPHRPSGTRGDSQREVLVLPGAQQRHQGGPLVGEQPPGQLGVTYVVHIGRSRHTTHANGGTAPEGGNFSGLPHRQPGGGAVREASAPRTRAAGAGSTSHFRWLPGSVRTSYGLSGVSASPSRISRSCSASGMLASSASRRYVLGTVPQVAACARSAEPPTSRFSSGWKVLRKVRNSSSVPSARKAALSAARAAGSAVRKLTRSRPSSAGLPAAARPREAASTSAISGSA